MQKQITFSKWVAPKPNTVSGFTLMELLVTITIAGILAAAAAPSFSSLISSQRVKTASFDLVAALTQTRSEAIKRNADVSMVPASGGWANGWTICLSDTSDPTKCATSIPILRSQSAYAGRCITESTGSDCTTANTLTFGGNGRLKTTATAFTIGTPPLTTVADNVTRCINISLSGQAGSKLKGKGAGAC